MIGTLEVYPTKKAAENAARAFRLNLVDHGSEAFTGIGLILRATNKLGRDATALAKFSEAYIGLPVQAGEQFAVLRALEIAFERGYRLLRVRSDYNQMRIALKDDYEAGVVRDEHTLRVMILRVAKKFDQSSHGYRAVRIMKLTVWLAKRCCRQRRSYGKMCKDFTRQADSAGKRVLFIDNHYKNLCDRNIPHYLRR